MASSRVRGRWTTCCFIHEGITYLNTGTGLLETPGILYGSSVVFRWDRCQANKQCLVWSALREIRKERRAAELFFLNTESRARTVKPAIPRPKRCHYFCVSLASSQETTSSTVNIFAGLTRCLRRNSRFQAQAGVAVNRGRISSSSSSFSCSSPSRSQLEISSGIFLRRLRNTQND